MTRLHELRPSVARQADRELVFDALQALQLAITRSYGGRPRAASGHGAQRRILEHLQQHLGEWITGDELAAVSGIGEWARRVRELRHEQGYGVEEEDGSYRLLAAEPDAAAARHWQTKRAIRRGDGTPKERVLALLSGAVGNIVNGSELSYVAGGRDATPLVRELRDKDALPIDSKADCRDLHGDEYRFLSSGAADRRDAWQHLYPESVRGEVFQRDDYTCWRCRRDRDATLAEGSNAPFFLEVHHLHSDEDDLDRLPPAHSNARHGPALQWDRGRLHVRGLVLTESSARANSYDDVCALALYPEPGEHEDRDCRARSSWPRTRRQPSWLDTGLGTPGGATFVRASAA